MNIHFNRYLYKKSTIQFTSLVDFFSFDIGKSKLYQIILPSYVFDDMLAIFKEDYEHSIGEARSYIIGHSSKNKLLVVAFTERNQYIRIITARNATKIERRYYEAQS